jgi:hypothetical protein
MKGEYKTSKGTALQVTNAAGVEGFLIRDAIDRKWYFRVYDAGDKSKFVDYALHHLDLHVRIDSEEMAAFYHDEDGNAWLDYSPEVLGLELRSSDDE